MDIARWLSFFIVDHTHFPKISKKLSAAFGIEFNNGHVDIATFHIENNSLMDHAITKGNSESLNDDSLADFIGSIGQEIFKGTSHSERIVKVKAFGGSAFQIQENAKPLLVLAKGATSLIPDIPFQLNADTTKVSVEGWYQGAVLEVERDELRYLRMV